jgi:hypothetical protein
MAYPQDSGGEQRGKIPTQQPAAEVSVGVKAAVTVMENCEGVLHRFAEPREFPPSPR